MVIIAIIGLFVGVSISPAIGGYALKSNTNKIEVDNESGKISPLTFYTFDKSGSKEYNSVLSNEVAKEINELLEVLGFKIINEPFSEETKILKSEFVELLEINGLLPEGMSKDKVLSLLNPSWLSWFEKRQHLISSRAFKTGFINILTVLGNLQRFFVSSDIIETLGRYPKPASTSAHAFFCSIFGLGVVTIPLFILPRPRVIILWLDSAEIYVGELLRRRGFKVSGNQYGIALGFIGLSILGYFIGYAVYVYVNADSIEWNLPAYNLYTSLQI